MLEASNENGQEEQLLQPALVKVCIHCFKAKVKCVRRKGGPTCDRCRRLNKECLFRESRRRHKTTDKDVRIEALEVQVEQLMAIAESTRGHSPRPNFPKFSPRNRNAHSEQNSLSAVALGMPRGEPNPGGSIANAATGPDEPFGDLKDVFSAGYLTLHRATTLLDRYRSSMTAHFPFVVISPEISISQMRKKKPFLLLAVLAVASYEDFSTQRLLGDEVRRMISVRMILSGETPLEILQGLLVFLAWYQYFSKAGIPKQYCQFLELAIGIIVYNRLDRLPGKSDWSTGIRVHSGNAPNSEFRGHDGKRALAGCYYLSSSISLGLRRTATMQHTPYVDHCCRSLFDDGDHLTDRYLIFIVQLQKIHEKINICYHQEDLNFSSDNFAVELYVTSLKSDLDSFKNRLPFPLEESHLLLMQFRTIELYLFQMSFIPLLHSRTSFNLTSHHLNALTSGLKASQSLFDFCLSLPLRSELIFNFTEWTQISFALTVTAKLSVIAAKQAFPHVNTSLTATLSASTVLTGYTQRMNALVSPTIDATGERDIFYYYKRRIGVIQSWYESQNFVLKQLSESCVQGDNSGKGPGHRAIDENGSGYVEGSETCDPQNSLQTLPEIAFSNDISGMGIFPEFPSTMMDVDFMASWVPSPLMEDIGQIAEYQIVKS